MNGPDGRGDARFAGAAGVDVRAVRRWVRREIERLGAVRTDLGDVDLMVDEIAANALRHTASGRSGGGVGASVREAAGVVRVEITDDGGAASLPVAGAVTDAWAEGGRGLALVAALAERWGFDVGDGSRRRVTVWFEVGRR
ncbi:ATP-binding protein [Actinomadura algeriensis]|uniref:Anti-sigma regulatory factor (Ser/Thr protein kinase) n=1 Tax=Actinomadura algeriensis TaxID=1679523 RepID=A0ABR9JLK1_9ACTN|nr:ATP-binding protein [Actinomadura algeriensis]MBE1531439.1 anti-sigma regulatory factor (Ser/Thr protein kinase) [Actinomadura algeriensis]